LDKTISHIGRIVALRIFYDMVRDILLEKGKALFIKELVPLLEQKGLRLPRKLVRYLVPMWEEGVVEEGSVNIRYRKEQVARPLEGDIEMILRNVGKPITLKILSQELAIVQRRLPEVYLHSLPSLLSSRPKKYFVLGDRAGLRRWLLQVERGAKEEDIVFYNFMDEEIKELEEWMAMPPLKGEKPIEEIKALLNERGAISHKVLSFLVWRARGDVDSLGLMKEMFEDGGFLMIKEATWVSKEQIPAAVALLKEIEIPPGAVEPEPFIFGKEEQEMFLSYIEGKDIISISKSARELFELEDVDMKQVEETLSEFLKGREGLLWVGGDKWTKLEKIPAEILAIPQEVEIDREFQYEDLDGEQLEVELSDEGLEDALPQLLKDPIIQETGDEEEIEVPPPQEEIQLVIPYHHYVAGTIPVRKWEKSFYPPEPRLQALTFIYEDEEMELWYNQDLPLIFGLKEWYKNNLPPSGAIIKIRREDEGIYRLIWERETHPLLSIPQRRLNDLLKLREELREQPTIEVIQTLLEYHKKAHFFTILSEVNIIRRTPKRRVASILSIFPCFYLREKEEGYFYYDSAKRDEVMKRSKKKYILTK
jgi:hypothetical protein